MLIASIPGLIMGFSIYWVVTGKVENELRRLHHNNIIQQERNVEAQFAALEMTFSHWSYDPNLGIKLKELNFASSYDLVQEIYRTLLIIDGSNSLISHTQLYLLNPKPVVIANEGYTFVSDSGSLAQYDRLLQERKSILWMDAAQLPFYKSQGQPTTLSLVSKLSNGSSSPYGMLVSVLNSERLRDLLKTLNPYGEGTSLLISNEGGWVISSAGSSTAIDQALETEFRSRQGIEESFLFTYKDITYSISSSEFTRLGQSWVILSAAPLSSITSPVLLISKIILFVSTAALALALILSWFASKRIYSPMDRLLRKLIGDRSEDIDVRSGAHNELEWIEMKWDALTTETKELRSRLDQQLPVLLEGFLMQMVQGYLYTLSEEELRERLEQFGLDLNEQRFGALVVEFRGLNVPEARFKRGDEELIAFAVGNIAIELAQNVRLTCQTLNFHDSTLGLFLILPQDIPEEECQSLMHEYGNEMIRILENILKLRAVVVLGHTTDQLSRVPYLFEETRQLLDYRELNGNKELLEVNQLNQISAKLDCPYNFLLEKEIIHALRLGSGEEAASLIRQFMNELMTTGVKKLIVLQNMYLLLGSIQHAMLQSGVNPVILFERTNLFQELSQLQEPEELLNWMEKRVIGTYMQELMGRQGIQQQQFVEKVLAYIQEQYQTDLSLESCADRFGTTPYTLSRAIKQVTGINFIDYLTNLRIGHAKELLRGTTLKISEVAELVGYQHTYFNRIFKKVEGVPPSQYREMIQKE
ncbi:MAG: helix-turn-helix protein [Paenibacillaceae bacterium]|nr:helix-turn-helix protein [Paenibacillaceae bacterium]